GNEFEERGDALSQFFELETFYEIVGGAELEGFDGGFRIVERGDHQNGDIAALLAHPLEKGDAVLAGHHDVEKNEAGLFAGQGFAGLFGGFGFGDAVLPFQGAAEAVTRGGFVVDNENGFHEGSLVSVGSEVSVVFNFKLATHRVP